MLVYLDRNYANINHAPNSIEFKEVMTMDNHTHTYIHSSPLQGNHMYAHILDIMYMYICTSYINACYSVVLQNWNYGNIIRGSDDNG